MKVKFISTAGKKKKMQYIIASIVFVVILFIWITIPLLNESSWDSKVSYGIPSKSASSALFDGVGVNAPGEPLTGALINNPATNPDGEASRLFSMPESDIEYEEKQTAQEPQVDRNVTPPAVSNPNSSVAQNIPKLSKMPSLGGSNNGTMTLGSKHRSFFGGGGDAKADLVPLDKTLKSGDNEKRKNYALMALQNAEKKSVAAAKSNDMDKAKGMAASAFEKTKKFDEDILNTDTEKQSANSGIELSNIQEQFRKNDPALSSKKITLPTPKEDEDENKKMEQQIKMMIIQMILQATLGSVFGAIGNMISMNMCPECYKKPSASGSSG